MTRIDILEDVTGQLIDYLGGGYPSELIVDDYDYQVLTALEHALEDYDLEEIVDKLPEECVLCAYDRASWIDSEPFKSFCTFVEKSLDLED